MVSDCSVNRKCIAVVLAGGKGKRMKNKIAKQYMLICDKPVLYYSLKIFQESFIDEIVLVCSDSDIAFVEAEIVNRYCFDKVKKIVAGGKERYHSVANGIMAAGACDYIFIHDGARPFVDEQMLFRLFKDVSRYGTAIAGMPVKDTIKIVGEDGMVTNTPDRNTLYLMQTPQVFRYQEIKEAYSILIKEEENCKLKITDDAMVMETFGKLPIKITEGSYQNIKITTPEDILVAEAFIEFNKTS